MPDEPAKARVPVRESTLKELRRRKTADGESRTYDQYIREQILENE